MARPSRSSRPRRSGKSTATRDINIPRLTRLFDAIERELRQMRYSTDLYGQDPGRFLPQLENAANSAVQVQNAARSILRTLGEKT
jgi:hypothetical protein